MAVTGKFYREGNTIVLLTSVKLNNGKTVVLTSALMETASGFVGIPPQEADKELVKRAYYETSLTKE